MSAPWLLYGANGYTGELIARRARVLGERPVLGGRSADAVAALAAELGLEHRVFALDDPAAIVRGLEGVKAVLHCAGPFSRTAGPMAEACLRAGAHYLDITGEIEVFESMAAHDAAARAAGVMLLSGVGFDVVPSDCLAAHLKRRLPTATHLALGFQASAVLSRGTMTTMVENLHRGGAVRRDGRIVFVPPAWKTRVIDFGRGRVEAVTIPWGDVATAYYTTGIPNIEVYMAAPESMRWMMRLARPLARLLRTKTVQALLKSRIRSGPAGPSAEHRARARSFLWGEARDASAAVVSRLETLEGYELTSRTALMAVQRVVAGGVSTGFQTPAGAFGPDFILEIEGTTRQDEDPRAIRPHV
ncbi:MAG: saccharopine dehydrogenase [Acidobacteria bacterium]|nr:MAG: saccharopine dehydrogenase [Acidobacteriota bacterium]